MKQFLFILPLLSTLVLALPSPSALERQVEISLQNISVSLAICSKEALNKIAPETRQLSNDLIKSLKSSGDLTLKFKSRNINWEFSYPQGKWNTARSQTGIVLSLQSQYFERESMTPKSLLGQIAETTGLLTESLARTFRSNASETAIQELRFCTEAAILRNSEIVTAGLGEMNIALVTLQANGATWPSFPRLVLTDGDTLYDLTTELLSLKAPKTPTVEPVKAVQGMVIARTAMSQHLMPTVRTFILPILQWSLVTEKGAPSAFIPDEFIAISFSRVWDSKLKLSKIVPDTIHFEHKRVAPDALKPGVEVESLSKEEQFQYYKTKAQFFGF